MAQPSNVNLVALLVEFLTFPRYFNAVDINSKDVTSEENMRTALNRVPEVTASFWIIKVMATTVGETGAISERSLCLSRDNARSGIIAARHPAAGEVCLAPTVVARSE